MICMHCDNGNESFYGYHYLENGPAQRCPKYVEPCVYTQKQVNVMIADLERRCDTAHAAAIQSAAERIRGIDYDELVDAILALTPANAQHLYDLRIAEAVRDEAKTAHDLDWRSWPSHRCLKKLDKSSGWSCRRLASASARVERLKSIIAE